MELKCSNILDSELFQQFVPLLKSTNLTQCQSSRILSNLIQMANPEQYIYLIYNDWLVSIPIINQKINQNEALSYFINQSRSETERIYGPDLTKTIQFYPK